MTGTVLERSLRLVSARLYKLRVLRRQTLCWLMLFVPALAVALSLPETTRGWTTNGLLLLGTTIVGLLLSRVRVARPNAVETAQLVEQRRPELNDAVLTAVHTDQQMRSRRSSSVLGAWAIEEADRLARQSDWRSVVPRRQMLGWSLLSFLTFAFLISGVVAAGRWGRDTSYVSQQGAAAENPAAAFDLLVEPGDVEIEQGTALSIVARFGQSVPAVAAVRWSTETEAVLLPMEPTVDAGVFRVRMNEVNEDGRYQVVFGSTPADLELMDSAATGSSSKYTVRTFVRPAVDQVDATITPPDYAQADVRTIEDTLRVTAAEGSTVQFTLHLNKNVAVAELRTEDGTVLPLTSAGGTGFEQFVRITATEHQKFEVYLEDSAGRTAADPPELSLRVTRNQRPKIKVTFPGRDTNVSPLQEFVVEAEATDDFGCTDFGIIYSLTGGQPVEQSLDADRSDAAGVRGPDKKVTMQYVIEMEQLQAEPDELLSYFFYVEDLAADGSPRRTLSDIQFAEVRRFEEVFREAQQQGQQSRQQQQQQQQGGNQSEQLLQLQRQILIATWNLQRTLDESTNRQQALQPLKKDADVVRQSQQQAQQQLNEMLQEVEDAAMAAIGQTVAAEMQAAVDELTKLTTADQVAIAEDSLQAALQAEQMAVAGLMRLRAKEHEVQRSQQQSGQGQGRQSSASQQQLRQLELNNEQNRYEAERQAQAQQEQTAAQREQLQILNRLKELARRQQMLNERLKQLESELRAAQSEEEKKEIERELKRLREEQRDMLRDVDELRETMDQQSAQQQQQNRQTREQVEQARDRVQRASQAMDDGQLSEAIAEGTRAERQFDELQEQFRQQTSGQFTEAMKDLRQQARDMQQRQQEIAAELNGQDSPDTPDDQPPSLRASRDRDQLEQKVEQQRDDLQRVLEQAQQMVEEAEESEPLLSRRLYDAIRKSEESRPDEALQATEILVGRGLFERSKEAEQIARKGIDQLTDDIENAADAVLGSEAETLERAQNELQNLTDELSGEIAQATGEQPSSTPNQNSAETNTSNESSEETETAARTGIRRQAAPSTNQQPRPAESSNNTPESPSDNGATTEPGESQPSRRQPAAGQNSDSDSNRPGSSDQQRPDGQNSSTGRQPSPGQDEQPSENEPQNSADAEGDSQLPGQSQESDSQQSSQQQSQQSSSESPGSTNSESQNSQNPSEGGASQSAGQSQQPGGQNGEAQSQAADSSQNQSLGQSNSSNPSGSQPSGRGQDAQRGQRNSLLMSGGRESLNGGPGQTQGRPLTGENFRDWSNRMREVEEILDDPELRNKVAQVRDRARSIRAEFKRHGTEPQWDLVKSQLLDEMLDLQSRLRQELLKLQDTRSMVPIDREPVPEEYDELVRRYYELLGRSEAEDQ
ncbi:MAG: hypothetical protein Fues2KO_38010 [Fuerstiella sp.]